MNSPDGGPAGLPLALWLMLLVLALAASITVWGVAQLFKNRRRSELLKAQAELQLKLLDKISSSEELRAFLQSEFMRTLLENQVNAARAESQDRIAGCLVPGCILTPVGAVLLAVGERSVRFLGTLSLAIGLGFLAASFIAYWLNRSWSPVNPGLDKQ
jgi:membrane protein implicated in regulation of membrane protease activity